MTGGSELQLGVFELLLTSGLETVPDATQPASLTD